MLGTSWLDGQMRGRTHHHCRSNGHFSLVEPMECAVGEFALSALATRKNLSDNGIVLGVGDVRVDLQYEWRYSTENNWQFAGFTDAGNVWLHGAEASPGEAWGWGDFSSWGWSAGAGIRYDLEFLF